MKFLKFNKLIICCTSSFFSRHRLKIPSPKRCFCTYLFHSCEGCGNRGNGCGGAKSLVFCWIYCVLGKIWCGSGSYPNFCESGLWAKRPGVDGTGKNPSEALGILLAQDEGKDIARWHFWMLKETLPPTQGTNAWKLLSPSPGKIILYRQI